MRVSAASMTEPYVSSDVAESTRSSVVGNDTSVVLPVTTAGAVGALTESVVARGTLSSVLESAGQKRTTASPSAQQLIPAMSKFLTIMDS